MRIDETIFFSFSFYLDPNQPVNAHFQMFQCAIPKKAVKTSKKKKYWKTNGKSVRVIHEMHVCCVYLKWQVDLSAQRLREISIGMDDSRNDGNDNDDALSVFCVYTFENREICIQCEYGWVSSYASSEFVNKLRDKKNNISNGYTRATLEICIYMHNTWTVYGKVATPI